MSEITQDTGVPVSQSADTRMYPALSLMERACPPLRYGRQPLWRLPALPVEEPFVPAWNWHAVRDFAPGTETVTLDANGAYIGAINQAVIAHSQLNRVGRLEYYPAPRDVAPGYYRITVPDWAFSGAIVSPLGDSARLQTEEQIWILHPTLTLLLELAEDGHIGAFDITDSWTAPVQTRFRTWYERLRAARSQLLDQVAERHPAGRPDDEDKCRCHPCVRYNAFKEGYAAALSMMATGRQSKTYRPDWAQTVYATHSATMWRKAWRYTGTNRHLVSMGHVDELQILAEDLPGALAHHRPPFQWDPTGRRLGAMKAKRYGVLQENIPTGSAITAASPEWEDFL